MTRLIDADALKKAFCNHCDGDEPCTEPCIDIGLIETAKTIDAVPVVRCEKCAYHSDIFLKGMEDIVWCNFFNLFRCKDSFCSCGQVE